MVKQVQMFQSVDGRLHNSEREAAKHELDNSFVDKMASLLSTYHPNSSSSEVNSRIRKEMGAWIVRNRNTLRELLIWIDVEETALQELYGSQEPAQPDKAAQPDKSEK